MKRFFALLLALCLLACLALPAGAASVSRQNVRVDGKTVAVQPYSVGGNNYFKLRDVAQLLSGTASRFSVSFDEAARAVSAAPGGAYAPIGGELSAGADRSASCVSSAWKLSVGGRAVSCSVFNIGGSNYFKLRDLGNVLGFAVDYDAASDTVLIASGAAASGYAPDVSFVTTDLAGGAWSDAAFRAHRLTMVNLWAYWCGPCTGELPDLQRLSEDYAAKGVQVLGICDAYDASDVSNARQKLASLGVTYPNLRYVSAFDGALRTGYVPMTVFIDQQGKIVGQAYVGARSYDGWAAVLNKLLA